MMRALAIGIPLLLCGGAEAGEIVKELRTGRTIGIISEGQSTGFVTDPRTGQTVLSITNQGSSAIVRELRTGKTTVIPRERENGKVSRR